MALPCAFDEVLFIVYALDRAEVKIQVRPLSLGGNAMQFLTKLFSLMRSAAFCMCEEPIPRRRRTNQVTCRQPLRTFSSHVEFMINYDVSIRLCYFVSWPLVQMKKCYTIIISHIIIFRMVY